MKKLKTFESFKEFVNAPRNNEKLEKTDVKKESKKRIEDEIDSAIEKYNKNPEGFRKYDVVDLRKKLSKEAKDNGYRGKVLVRKSPDDKKSVHANKKFIVYDRKSSPLQEIGALAAQYR